MESSIARYNAATGLHIESLKPMQLTAIENILKGQDTLAVLPTAYGKSLIYEIIPYASTFMCIIVVPLNAIIDQQIKKLGPSCQKLADIKLSSIEVNYVIGHPEQFLEAGSTLRELSKTGRHFVIVVDEAHCILEWGPDFTPQYTDIHKIKTLLGGTKNCTILGLTATASSVGQNEIIANLRMKEVSKIVLSPIRDNIYLSVMERKAAPGDESNVERTY